MKPVLELLPKDGSESFLVTEFDFKYFPTPWHFHPEYEIVLITSSTGKRFIGGNISNFKPGDLAFIGSNLPHLYRSDTSYYKPDSMERAISTVVHFTESSLGNDFLSLPEIKKIKQLLIRSQKGLEITGETNKVITDKLFKLINMSGCARYLKLLEILHIMSESKECHVISEEAITGINEKESDRMDKVLKFIMINLADDINLPDVAKIAKMSENSFSRFFKQRTRKTFTSYLNELRLNQAAKLLIESDKTILDICYECGFSNPSNFHRYFKRMYQTSPLHYRKTFWGTVW